MMEQSRKHSPKGAPRDLEALEKPSPAPHPGKVYRLAKNDDPGSGPAPHPGKPPRPAPHEDPGTGPAPHPGPPAPRIDPGPAPHPGPPPKPDPGPAPHPGKPPGPDPGPAPHPGKPPRPIPHEDPGTGPAPHPGAPPRPMRREDPGGPAPHPGPPPKRHTSADQPHAAISPVAGSRAAHSVDLHVKRTREIACEKPVRNTSFSGKASIVGIVPFTGTPKTITLVGNKAGKADVTFLFTDGTSDRVRVSVVE